MKVNTSPMVAPSADRRRCASAERASLRSKNPARLPEQLAGESKKTWCDILFQAMPRSPRKVLKPTSHEPELLVVAGREIAVTNPTKVLFPKPEDRKSTRLNSSH